MTAGAMLEDREQCIKAGMDEFIAKPMKPIDLIDPLKKEELISLLHLDLGFLKKCP